MCVKVMEVVWAIGTAEVPHSQYSVSRGCLRGLPLDGPPGTAGLPAQDLSDLTSVHPSSQPPSRKASPKKEVPRKLEFTYWHCHLPAVNYLTSLICVPICEMGISPLSEDFCKDEKHKDPSSVSILQVFAC